MPAPLLSLESFIAQLDSNPTLVERFRSLWLRQREKYPGLFPLEMSLDMWQDEFRVYETLTGLMPQSAGGSLSAEPSGANPPPGDKDDTDLS